MATSIPLAPLVPCYECRHKAPNEICSRERCIVCNTPKSDHTDTPHAWTGAPR